MPPNHIFMFRIIPITFLSFFFATIVFAQTPFQEQKRDYIWLTGYSSNGNPNSIVGGTLMDFNQQPASFEYQYRELNFDITNASICDEQGNLLVYTNGQEVVNREHEIMENGDSLVVTIFNIPWEGDGLPLYQGALFLPQPGNEQLINLFHEEREWAAPDDTTSHLSTRIFNLYLTLIDMEENGGLGKVVEKRNSIVIDTLGFGKITSVRHANGRDWWILVPEFQSNRFYRFLLSPEGLQEYPIVDIGSTIVSGLGQSVFSPDGNWYARVISKRIEDGQFLDIFRFDRCAGEFYDPIQVTYNDTANATGVAISPNSRYLYVPSFKYVYQLDLWADDIAASKELIAVWDGFSSPVPLGSTTFFLAQLAPNGKIYINANNTTDYLHVIHNPNAAHPECNLEQHGQQLPTLNKFSIPNNPYWRLGPLDGSPCDTLGVDNHPKADFRYLTEDLSLDFYDYSLFDPQEWFWTFGDGQSSMEQNPQHTYTQSGIYEVCLTVSNDNASDTYCEEINLLIDEVTTLQPGNYLNLFPNPARDWIYLQLQLPQDGTFQWQLYDALGYQVRQSALTAGQLQQIMLEDLPSGLYYWTLSQNRQQLQSGKVVVE